jgi:hypothetical protein
MKTWGTTTMTHRFAQAEESATVGARTAAARARGAKGRRIMAAAGFVVVFVAVVERGVVAMGAVVLFGDTECLKSVEAAKVSI